MEVKLTDLLTHPSEYEWNHSVYVPGSMNIELETNCIILDSEEFEEPDCPKPVLEKGYKQYMDISQVQDVISNVEQQNKTANLEQKLAALKHYYKNDAFINL